MIFICITKTNDKKRWIEPQYHEILNIEIKSSFKQVNNWIRWKITNKFLKIFIRNCKKKYSN